MLQCDLSDSVNSQSGNGFYEKRGKMWLTMAVVDLDVQLIYNIF